jgi:hypothetical protein
MKKTIYTLCFALVIGVQGYGQNLALSATATASASSGGNYGPSNWNNGVKNGSFFGWVGTDPATFPMPAFMEFTWAAAQTFDSIVIFNVGANFAPPSGNAVVFNGTANLEYWDGTTWHLITSFVGQGSYGGFYSLTFPAVTATKFRIVNLVTGPGSHNPGFDEVEAFLNNPPFVDLALTQVSFVPDIVNMDIEVSATVKNMGSLPVQGFLLSYRINPTGLPNLDSVAAILQPGDSITHNFSNKISLVIPSPIANDVLCAMVQHPQDINPANDDRCIALTALLLNDEKKPLVTIYPNPSNGLLYIQSNIPVKRALVRSLDGREMGVFEQPTQIDLSQWPTGVYFIQIETHRGESFYKVVRQ